MGKVQTNFNEVTMEKLVAEKLVAEELTGKLSGMLMASPKISNAADYALTSEDKKYTVIVAEMTEASKVLTLGLAANEVVIVYNTAATTFTVKNIAADTGTSLATTKAILVVGGTTKDTSIVIALN